MLLVYLVGVVLSVVHLKRLGEPAALALVGCGMLFLITTLFPFVQGYIISQHDRLAEMGLWMGVAGLVRMVLHAVAFSLLLAAIFTGRRVPAGPGYGYGAATDPEAGFPEGDLERRSSV
jgi:hypothetical protein